MSIGNILFCDGGAKLADLEYAKRVGDTKCHDLRTASRFSTCPAKVTDLDLASTGYSALHVN